MLRNNYLSLMIRLFGDSNRTPRISRLREALAM
jgi:hypothetical protein